MRRTGMLVTQLVLAGLLFACYTEDRRTMDEERRAEDAVVVPSGGASSMAGQQGVSTAPETEREVVPPEPGLEHPGRDVQRAATEAGESARTTGEKVAEEIGETGAAIGRVVDRAEVQLEDAEILTKIKGKYALDDFVKATNIDVDIQKGVVTLSGTVANDNIRRRAEELARETEGVQSVVNRLTVAR